MVDLLSYEHEPPGLPRALALLRVASTDSGIVASLDPRANYASVFARDGVIAGIAGVTAGDDVIARGLVRTLRGLAERQGDAGQIPSNYRVATPSTPAHVSYGTLTPKLDAATWFLVGSAVAVRAGLLSATELAGAVRRAVRLLDAWEYNGRGLVYVPSGGNWADEYPYEGYVLYDQVLRAWGLRLCATAFDEPMWSEDADRIGQAIAVNYWPTPHDSETDAERYHTPTYAAHRRSDRTHPLAAFSPARTLDVFDGAAGALLAFSNVAPPLTDRTLDGFQALFPNHLPPAFAPTIHEDDALWDELRRYHLFGFRNAPGHYHNGGIWPVWVGWTCAALAARNRPDEAAQLSGQLVDRTTANTYRMEEYFHGETGAAGGTPHMTYSATGVLLAHLALNPGAFSPLLP